MIRWIIISFLFILFFLRGDCQSCDLVLQGRVLDKATKEPLAFSTLGIIESGVGTIADSAGKFFIKNICPGDYHIQVFHIGCPTAKYYIPLLRDTSVVFYLEHHGELLSEVIVKGKQDGRSQSSPEQSISAEMIRENAGLSLAEITKNISGVSSLRSGGSISKPVIHGLLGNRVAVINNGLTQAGQQWGADHAPEVDPNAAGIITVVKGSDAIQYGSHALAGALIIDAGPIPEDPHWHGAFGYTFNLNGRGHIAHSRITRTFKKWDFRWTGSLKRGGDHKAPDYYLTNTGVFERNSSFQVKYRVNQRIQHQLYYSVFNTTSGVFSGAHISNLTDLEAAIGSEVPFNIRENFSYRIDPPKQEVTHHLLKFSGKNFIKEDVHIEWLYGLQLNRRKEFDIRRGNRSSIPALDLRLIANSAEFKYVSHQEKFSYTAGIQGKWLDNTNDPETGILPLIPDYIEANGALYFNTRLNARNWNVEFGGRYDYQFIRAWTITNSIPPQIVRRDHRFHDFAFAGGLIFEPGEKLATKLNGMLVRRSPEINELYSNGLHQGVAGIEEGDFTLVPETSFKTILTQSFGVEKLFHVEVNAYVHLIYDYIFLKPQNELRLTIRGAFPVYRYTQENSWIRGLDFILISDVSRQLEVVTKLSFLRGSTLDGVPLSLMPPFDLETTISMSLQELWETQELRIWLKGNYTGRQHQWDESELLEPPADYFLFSVGIEAGIRLGNNFGHFSILSTNLLNLKYKNYLNRLRYFAVEEGRSIRLNLRYEF